MSKFDELKLVVVAALAAADASVAHAVTVMQDAAAELASVNSQPAPAPAPANTGPTDEEVQAVIDQVNGAVPLLKGPLDAASVALSAVVAPLPQPSATAGTDTSGAAAGAVDTSGAAAGAADASATSGASS
jgi:hypothetical protein